MTSNLNVTEDPVIIRDGSNNSRMERRTTSSTFSNSRNRFSIGSSDTGASSTAATRLSRSPVEDGDNQEFDAPTENDGETGYKDWRNGRRSHKSKSGGGFLLSQSLLDPASERPRHVTPDAERLPQHHLSKHGSKGKRAAHSAEKRQSTRISSEVAKSSGSPLAIHVASVSSGQDQNVQNEETERPGDQQGANSSMSTASTLDIDTAQIVNLALNLNERRNAARRNISSPLPPPAPPIESFTGHSLRQTLQQQRRSSRTVSPKPDHGDRALVGSPRHASGQRVPSPLQPAFGSNQAPSYEYHFSSSTLARAEKAKAEFELMAQYRRLLQYVPPLTPNSGQIAGLVSTASESPASVAHSGNRNLQGTARPPLQLGRPYNPLQYIRNRKVRARERRSIDGEAQGFGDVHKVKAWVDAVELLASSRDAKAGDSGSFITSLPLPPFLATDISGDRHSSPQSGSSKNQTQSSKIKRPRVDWIFHAADMLADLVWLEQDDNKRAIEDNHGHKIFPQLSESKRASSHRPDELEQLAPAVSVPVQKGEAPLELRLDTKLPEFRSIKVDSENLASRARHALHDATHLHHSHNRNHVRHKSANAPILFLSPTKSDSEDSDSDSVSRGRLGRAGTVESQDMDKDILQKQMMGMLAKQGRSTGWSSSQAHEAQLENTAGSKSTSNGRSDSVLNEQNKGSNMASPKNESFSRASLEVPTANPRTSLEEFDSTAPNSPQAGPSRTPRGFIPSIAIDVSPPTSRDPSPTRSPLSKVRSRIGMFRDHSRERGRTRGFKDEGKGLEYHSVAETEHVPERPATPGPRDRSPSPVKQQGARKADDNLKLSKSNSLRRGKLGEESSGIKALFKGGRGHVNRVTELIRKKDISQGQGNNSGFSTDDSDFEDAREAQPDAGSRKHSHERSRSIPQEQITEIQRAKEPPSYLKEMPTFKSPFDLRSRADRTRPDGTEKMVAEDPSGQQASREERQGSITSSLREPPKIDVQLVQSSSDPDELFRQKSQGDSDISEQPDSRRPSYVNGIHRADARLNAILGIPGRKAHTLPVTGLANLETSNKRPSLEGKRQWSISDRSVSLHRGPMTKREIARTRALLLSSGIKANEIARRAAEVRGLGNSGKAAYIDVANLAQGPLPPVPRSSEHILAARILQDDIQVSAQAWEAAANIFCGATMNGLIQKLDDLQARVSEQLIPMASKAGDEADEVSKDLVMNQTLAVKRLEDSMNKMIRRRRRKFRWLRRGGWVMLEWVLVGVMWSVWLIVMLARTVLGFGRVTVGAVRWLLWL